MLKLYRTGRYETLGDVSPFVYKLETWLRLSGIPHECIVKPTRVLLEEAPRNLIPFVDLDDERLADSTLIIDRLKRDKGDPLGDDGLTPDERALGTLVKSMCEHELFYIMIYGRWLDGDYKTFAWFGTRAVPEDQRDQAVEASLEWVKNMLHGFRIGRYDPAFVRDALRDKLNTLAHVLGDKPWLFGDAPSTFDAGLYAILASFIHFPLPNPHVEIARGYENLVAYCDRIKAQHWDPDEWVHGA